MAEGISESVYQGHTNLLWWIKQYLKAGVITEGIYEDSEEGSAQGNIISHGKYLHT